MPELLLEVGTEELPATFVRRAYTDLRDRIAQMLADEGLGGGDGVCLGTPRRLIVSFPTVLERQPDSEKESRGPAVKAAFDAAGNPTPALQGFCRGQGIEPAALRNDGQYVWATKFVAGEAADNVLARILPEAIRKLAFDKSMRWGTSKLRFARPIRWLLATLDGGIVPFEIEGVISGNESRGHRFYAPEAFSARSLAELLGGLRDHRVEPDPELRRKMIAEGASEVARGEPDQPEGLVDENVFLTEWPTAIRGEFRSEFLNLPEPVLVTAMAKHERMFPVRSGGKITNAFIFIRNSGEDDTVRRGAEWVLNARFNDAQFFYEQDQRTSLEGFLEKTEGILYQERLGSVRRRADRLASLAAEVARATGATEEETPWAYQAGRLAKADLSTGLVSELNSLQGVVGAEYGKRQGLPEAVTEAIGRQYQASRPSPQTAADRTAIRLVIADHLDKLAGYLGLGLEPSGSSDPFGLRRSATQLIEAAWIWPTSLPSYEELFSVALHQYQQGGIELDGDKALTALRRLFASRYGPLLPEVRYDILEAALIDPLGEPAMNPQAVRFRAQVLGALASDVPFIQTATRPINIVASARKKGIEVSQALPEANALGSEAGAELRAVLTGQTAAIEAASTDRDEAALIQHLRRLADPINEFFAGTMVMDDDPLIRAARLSLMEATSRQLFFAGDFTKIVVEGA